MKYLQKILPTTIIVFFCVLSVLGKPLKMTWQAGQVTLCSNTILEGNIAYNWLAEMVMLRQPDGRVSTYSAEQVLQFGWFDYNQHKYRIFKSLPNSAREERATYGFFEVYMDGSLTVVRRIRQPHGLFKRAFGHPENYADKPMMAQNHDQFDYFVEDAGQLLAFDRFYLDIYMPILITYDRELRHYVTQHNLNDRTTVGRLVLVDQYNFLVQHNTRTASAKNQGTTLN